MTSPTFDEPVVLDRREGPYGEVALRRHGELYQIIANGCFLMDTSDGRSERLLVRAALDEVLPRVARPHLLIGGLGVGFSLAEAAAEPACGRITVVEREAAVIDWHRPAGAADGAAPDAGGAGAGGGAREPGGEHTPQADLDEAPLTRFSGHALADPRVSVVHADLLEHLSTTAERYDALCLDIDNGPDWTVTEGNNGLYGGDGTAALARLLTAGGVLAVWSASASSPYEACLRAHFATVRRIDVPVVRGNPDVVYLASQSS